jgi:1-acyl-sn-glycerol-3-phosphate acyltransferase
MRSLTGGLQSPGCVEVRYERPPRGLLDVFYLASTALCELVFFLAVDRTVLGRERVPRRGPFVLLANHVSHFDPPLIGSPLWRRVNWVTARDLYVHPVVERIFRLLGCIPFDRTGRDVRAMKAIVSCLRRGEPVGIFPEGGIRHGAESVVCHGRLERGATLVAWREAVPVVPAVILGADALYAPRNWPKWCRVYVGYGWPVFTEGVAGFEYFHRMCEEGVAGLVRQLRQRFDLGDEILPRSAQEHWGAG